MTDHDETGGWVFSDEYHQWQDEKPNGNGIIRGGSITHLMTFGWGAGLYSIRTDDKENISASWPQIYDELGD